MVPVSFPPVPITYRPLRSHRPSQRDTDGGICDGAWVTEATGLVNLSSWPAGTRLILRKERPHPGAQLRFTDADDMRVTAFITDTAPGLVPRQVAGPELRHRQHARIEDHIRELKATGLRNPPCHAFGANAAWLEIILAAADLVTWCRLIGFTSHPRLARAETTTFRYRVPHVAARITRGPRRTPPLDSHPITDPSTKKDPPAPGKVRPTRRHGNLNHGTTPNR